MSALRYIDEYTWDNASYVDVKNVFTDDFKIYQLIFNGNKGYGQGKMQFWNAGGSLIDSARYAYGYQNLVPTTNSTFNNSSGSSTINVLTGTPTGTNGGDLNELWVFNPTAHTVTGVTTHGLCSASATANRGRYGVGMHKDKDSITGFRILPIVNTITGGVKIYGFTYEDMQ